MDLRDDRGLVGSFLAKMVVGFAIAAVILFDAGSIAVNYFGLSSTAGDIAVQVATGITQTGGASLTNVNCGPGGSGPSWCAQAAQLAKDADARLVTASIDQTGVLHITLKREANTLIVSRIDAISKWGKASADGQASIKE